MRFISTRGAAPVLPFDDVLLTGLAEDGGLYLPGTWPQFDDDALSDLAGRPYDEVATRIMAPFVGDTIPLPRLAEIAKEAYGGFSHKAVAPLRQMAADFWLMELFHGPTLAFKDYALQLVGRLFDEVLTRKGGRITVIGATSGDTGSAAIEACRDRDAVDIFMLYPKGRVSPVQERQMTTVLSPNVHNLAIEGTFDDCQAMVKAMFADTSLRRDLSLSAVNSINWARVMAQIVYYFVAALSLGRPGAPVSFAVPTGNFGNVFAGYAARQMGLPIRRLVVGSNANDILARFLASGEMRLETVQPTLSPSMDIQISSNFERLLFDMQGRDGGSTAATLADFTDTGGFSVDSERLGQVTKLFRGATIDDEATLAEIRRVHEETGMIVDPHSAVGIAASRACAGDGERGATICLATAHPAKFPDAVKAAIGIEPALPPHLADLMERPTRVVDLPNDVAAVSAHIRRHARAGELVS